MKKVNINKNPDNFQKARQFALRFYSQKIKTLQKSETICVTFFYVQKA